MLVGGESQKGVIRGLQPDQQADGARRHLGPDGQTVGHRRLNPAQQVAPGLGMAMALGQREGQGYTGARHHGAHQLELAVGVWPEIRDQLHDAMPGIGDAEGDGLELVRAGAQRRGRVPAGRAVVERARGREADRSGAHGLGGQRAHGGSVLGGGILQAGRPLAHHVEAQRPVGKLCAQVDVVRAPLDRVEILAEALP